MREFLEGCRRIEQAISRVYGELAAAEGFGEGIRGLFHRLAEEERDHVRWLDLALRLAEEGVFGSTKVSLSSIDLLLLKTENLHGMLRRMNVSEEEALCLGQQLEQDFRELYQAFLERVPDQGLRRMLQILAGSDEEHLRLLSSCLH